MIHMPAKISKKTILDSLDGLSKRELQQIITKAIKAKGFQDKSVTKAINKFYVSNRICNTNVSIPSE